MGVYGFIFFRDGKRVGVVTDGYVPIFSSLMVLLISFLSSLLFVVNPKFVELRPEERRLKHYDLDAFSITARRGRKALYDFARSTTGGGTWIPLIEKAYAKFHFDYVSLSGGFANEAIEDLTGCVESDSISDIYQIGSNVLSKSFSPALIQSH